MNEQHVSGRLTVDLTALAKNYKTLAALAPKAETGAAVKGEAYGLGLKPCITALWKAGCRSFFVARPREGADVRRILPKAKIYVLDGFYAGAASYYLKHKLIPALISADEACEWAAKAKGAPCAIHVDSGINRVSFPIDELKAILSEKLKLRIVLLMSHLASSEEPANRFNQTQRQRFAEARASLPNVPASLANSSGCFLGKDFTLDLTRPGVALYGGNPLPGHPNPMLPVATLEARVLQVRDVPMGEAVGYNSTWRATRPSKVALLGAGYRDGIPRRMSSVFEGKASVWLGGARCPIVGRVSMDMTAVDVTEVQVKRGDFAEFFGHHISLDEAATSAGTISWELLTHLGSRYAYKYIK
ncbi:MAG TPA: alanine racemase [Aestuariivirga sp.]